MTKLIIILLVVAGLAILGVTFVMKSVKRFFSAFSPTQDHQKTTGRDDKKYDNVIYNKDDVVVLKGEAKNGKKEKNKFKSFFNKSNNE